MRHRKNTTTATIKTTQRYASMSRMSDNEKCTINNFSDSLQLTNWILESGATCHMTPEVSDFVPILLDDTDRNIEVTDIHHVTAKQKGKVQIKCVTIFITTLHNLVLAPDLCERLFSNITLINLGHTCLFHNCF